MLRYYFYEGMKFLLIENEWHREEKERREKKREKKKREERKSSWNLCSFPVCTFITGWYGGAKRFL